MIRIAISQAAFDAIAATLPLPANCFALGMWDIRAQRARVKPPKFQTETLPSGRVIHFWQKSPRTRCGQGAGQTGTFAGRAIQRAGCGTMTSQGRTVNCHAGLENAIRALEPTLAIGFASAGLARPT
jgi:hypothetical protein